MSFLTILLITETVLKKSSFYGGYTGEEANLFYTVVTFGELSRLKALVKKTDQNTFLVASKTFEVMGHGIGNQPHW